MCPFLCSCEQRDDIQRGYFLLCLVLYLKLHWCGSTASSTSSSPQLRKGPEKERIPETGALQVCTPYMYRVSYLVECKPKIILAERPYRSQRGPFLARRTRVSPSSIPSPLWNRSLSRNSGARSLATASRAQQFHWMEENGAHRSSSRAAGEDKVANMYRVLCTEDSISQS